MRLSRYFKIISRILIVAMLHLCWLTSYGYAEMVPTESANQSQYQDDRQRLLELLNRQEVIDELEKYGISKVEAVVRINSLSDEEVTKIAGKLDELPEGGYVGGYAAIIILIPAILLGVFYVAFTPIAAGVCIFKEDSWNDCMGDYWESYKNTTRNIYVGGDNAGERGIGGYFTDHQNKATANLDKQVCRFDCNEAEKVCFESISEEEDTNTGKLQCEEAKNACFQQCESN